MSYDCHACYDDDMNEDYYDCEQYCVYHECYDDDDDMN